MRPPHPPPFLQMSTGTLCTHQAHRGEAEGMCCPFGWLWGRGMDEHPSPRSPAQHQCWQPKELCRTPGPRALGRWGKSGLYSGLRTTRGFPGSSEGPLL